MAAASTASRRSSAVWRVCRRHLDSEYSLTCWGCQVRDPIPERPATEAPRSPTRHEDGTEPAHRRDAIAATLPEGGVAPPRGERGPVRALARPGTCECAAWGRAPASGCTWACLPDGGRAAQECDRRLWAGCAPPRVRRSRDTSAVRRAPAGAVAPAGRSRRTARPSRGRAVIGARPVTQDGDGLPLRRRESTPRPRARPRPRSSSWRREARAPVRRPRGHPGTSRDPGRR